MHQLGKLTKNFVVLDSCNDNKRLSILFYSISKVSIEELQFDIDVNGLFLSVVSYLLVC